jgi:hypothetical protein
MRDRLANDPNYKAKHLARVRKTDERAREAVKALIASFRETGCILCREAEHACLSAHHVKADEKDFNIGDASRKKMSAARVEQELAKCICLCHNCHAKVHAGIVVLLPQPNLTEQPC